ncbi:MAG TPA: glycosyltransferase [Gemmatimonadales bacterium]|nr:glycosyltransferase [Gemmatimonadales bacterium]
MSVRRVLVISHLYLDPAHRGKLRALAARDLDVTVGIPQRWVEPGLGRLIETRWERQGSVEIFPIPAAGHADGAGLKFGKRELKSLLRDKRPDLVQIEEDPMSPAAAQVGALARRAQIPAIVFTAENVERPTPWLARRRRRRLLERSRGVIAGSAGAADLARRVRADLPVTVIPQLGVAVPPAPEHAYHEGLHVGYVGRLVPEKGIDTLLLALAANRGERWSLTIVGEGPERERLERLASEARLASRTRWVGALPPDQLESLWPTLDVLVQPSRNIPGWSEPTGQVLMEAMAHEVVVVGSDGGVTPEIIGEAGIVVPTGDPAALAAALRRLAADSERRPLMQAGRARVLERFSDVAVAERTAAFWREVLG